MSSEAQGTHLTLYGMVWHAGAVEIIAAIAVLACVIGCFAMWRRCRGPVTRERSGTPKGGA